MTLAVFTGHEALTFQDYADLATGGVLRAEPGRVYDVAPASGRNVPDVPAGWFTPVAAEPPPDAASEAASEAADEPPEAEPEPDLEPAGEPQQPGDENPQQ